MKDFSGKIAFITGGASGAGFGQAQVFSEAGCKVVIADIRQDHLDEALAYFKQKGAPAHAIKLDITDRAAYAAAADEVESVFGGPPELLINTAGVNTFGPAEASTYEDYDWVVGVNLGGVINGMVTFVPRMIKAGKGGHIATTASWGGFAGGAITAPYSAAKAAVINLMESYYLSLRPYNIGVSVLCPENIKSNIFEAVKTRPENLQNTGYNMGESTIDFLRKFHAIGMEPRDLAVWLKTAIENDQFLVIPYDNAKEMLENRSKILIDYSSPEGMRKIEEAAKQQIDRRTEREKEDNNKLKLDGSTFGKAKGDIAWVDPSKK
jgi:NAD(P)-dependent dehydrogenase (short-subunit alcohol dehydrogenase family)